MGHKMVKLQPIHGFAAETGNRRDEAGANLADSRTEAFFAQHLA